MSVNAVEHHSFKSVLSVSDSTLSGRNCGLCTGQHAGDAIHKAVAIQSVDASPFMPSERYGPTRVDGRNSNDPGKRNNIDLKGSQTIGFETSRINRFVNLNVHQNLRVRVHSLYRNTGGSRK